jgi:hypothetical protein
MNLVAKALEEDKAKGTLGSLQLTSSALYDIATPYIYRRVELVVIYDAIRLFTVFGEVSLWDRELFNEPVPVDSRHIIEQNLVYRLRYYMSLIHYLHFTTPHVDAYPGKPYESQIGHFHDIHDGMRKADQDANLWSSLREMHLDYSLAARESDIGIDKLLFTPDPRPRDLYVLRAPNRRFHGHNRHYKDFNPCHILQSNASSYMTWITRISEHCPAAKSSRYDCIGIFRTHTGCVQAPRLWRRWSRVYVELIKTLS